MGAHPPAGALAASVDIEMRSVRLVGVFVVRALLFGVCFTAPDFCKHPCGLPGKPVADDFGLL